MSVVDRRRFLRSALMTSTILFAGAPGLAEETRGQEEGVEEVSLGDRFEEKEDQLFGKNGFERVVAEIAGIEKELGIHDLSDFTPRESR